ncbi:MAG: enzyme of heme biosynthesis [Marivirga sp.]|nr:enzyme of heme biosynthesis [Marivirga sp.]
MTNRIEQLQQFVKEDPNDPFNQYALGLEYIKTDKVKASKIFSLLIHEHAGYLPTYYHLGKLYQELEEIEKALQVFELGIDQAKKQNDQKTLRELLGAKQELLFES